MLYRDTAYTASSTRGFQHIPNKRRVKARSMAHAKSMVTLMSLAIASSVIGVQSLSNVLSNVCQSYDEMVSTSIDALSRDEVLSNLRLRLSVRLSITPSIRSAGIAFGLEVPLNLVQKEQ